MPSYLLQLIAPIASAVLGGGGLISLLLARKERKSAAQVTEANAIAVMQQVYRQFVSDTASEIGALKEEIKRLRDVVESYRSTCGGCPNNLHKKHNGYHHD